MTATGGAWKLGSWKAMDEYDADGILEYMYGYMAIAVGVLEKTQAAFDETPPEPDLDTWLGRWNFGRD